MTRVKPDSAREIAYYVVVVVGLALLVIDMAGDGPQWGNIPVFVLIAAAVLLRPGGLFKNRKK